MFADFQQESKHSYKGTKNILNTLLLALSSYAERNKI